MIQQLWIQYPGSALETPVMASGDVITITLPRHEPLHYLVYVAEHIGDTWHAHITAAGKGGCRIPAREKQRGWEMRVESQEAEIKRIQKLFAYEPHAKVTITGEESILRQPLFAEGQ